MKSFSSLLFLSVVFIAFCSSSLAQDTQMTISQEDYRKAAQFLFASSSVYHNDLKPHWIDGNRFWFKDVRKGGYDFIIVDPAKNNARLAFNQNRLASEIQSTAHNVVSKDELPLENLVFSTDNKTASFNILSKRYRCDLDTYKLVEIGDQSDNKDTIDKEDNDDQSLISPDGKWKAFLKENNLWIRDLNTNNEIKLTSDGESHFGYATDNAGWRHSDNPIILWSPDSKKIATYKQDERKVGAMHLVSTQIGEPQLESWKYELPLDKNIFQLHRVIIDVESQKIIPLDIAPDARRSTHLDDILYNGHLADAQWSADAQNLAFVSSDRYHKEAKVRIAHAETGTTRTVFEENIATQFQSGFDGINWRYLSKSKEIVWFSERDDRGHLYLYDAETGKLKNRITQGEYVVSKIEKIDEEHRQVYFMAAGLQSSNPYFVQLCKIGLDGKGFQVLTPEEGNHTVEFSPSGDYFIDTYSQPEAAPISAYKTSKGESLFTILRADISPLKEMGWQPPQPIKVKAADGKTDLYGLMYKPKDLVPDKKYPIINYIYPGPQGGTILAYGVEGWSFKASKGDNQALAELGFVVIEIEGTGNPLRTKSFQDMNYGHMAINTLPDQIAGIRQLAAEYPFLDTTKIGIWGHSGGGFATAAALLKYPEFYKVGIAESGNHDNRNYESDWGDRYNGPLTSRQYQKQANATYAKNLKGKLMLAVGLMDDNVPPQNTFLLVQALQKAGKDFDLVTYPDSRHGYGMNYYYQTKKRWDYFVRHLLEKEPPKDFQFFR